MRTPRLYSVGQHSHGIQPKTSELGGKNAAYHWKTPRLLAVYAVETGDNSGIFIFRSATSTRRAFQRIRRFCSVYVIPAVYFTLDRKQNMRIVMAFLLAPAFPSLLVNVGLIAANISTPRPPFQVVQLIDPSAMAISYVAALIAGVPAYLFLRGRLNRIWWRYCLWGSAIGCVPALIFQAHELSQGFGLGFGPIAFAVGLTYGAVAGFTFWAIGIAGPPTHAAV